MTSVVPSVQTPTIGLVQGSQAPTQVLVQKSGNTLPQDGKVSATAAAAQPTAGQQQTQSNAASQQQTESSAASKQQTVAAQQTKQKQQEKQQVPKTDVAQQVAVVNKFLNDSGRAAQFRASSDDKTIQEVNPATGEVIAEYSATTFEALARSVGITGEQVVDEHA